MGFAVGINMHGQERTMIVTPDSIRIDNNKVPGIGQLLVTLVAELPVGDPFGKGFLAELPAVPQEGSQRVKVKEEELQAA